jgi:DNA-binding transcriptional ArsR family regulator
MPDVFVLNDIEQIRAMADPLRQRIVEALIDASLTTKQVAQQLKEQPTKLYHHVELLEKAGIIKLVETRPKRGTVEKYYRAVAQSFTVDRDLFSNRPESDETAKTLLNIVGGMFETTLAEMRESLAAKLLRPGKKMPSRMTRNLIRSTPANIEKLNQKLNAIIDECDVLDSEDGEVAYGLTVAFYPIVTAKSKKGKKK